MSHWINNIKELDEVDLYALDVLSQEEAEEKLLSTDPIVVAYTLLSISLYQEDRDWAETQCLTYLSHSNVDILYAAILSIAHIARIDKKFNNSAVKFFKEYLNDPTLPTAVRGRVEDAIDDICMFTDTDEFIFRA